MSMIPTKITDRDAEFAALLGHKQTESTWKPILFLIARFREESEKLALKEIRDEIQQARDLVAKMVLDKTKELAGDGVQVLIPKNEDLPPTRYIASDPSAFVHKLDDSVIWAMFASAANGITDSSIEAKTLRADQLLARYKAKFGNG